MHEVTSVDELTNLYPAPVERALRKEIDRFDEHCRTFIAASPFVLLATSGSGGGDCSPRGDQPGFVHVADDRTLHIPDRRGNNRLDSLRNIVENPEVGLLFMIPGVNETLRVNGRAQLTTDPAILEDFRFEEKRPTSVIVVELRTAYIQCARALIRSELWNPDRFVERSSLPSMGTILAAHTGGAVVPDEYDVQTAAIICSTLY